MLQEIMTSMPNRPLGVIKAKGYQTSYEVRQDICLYELFFHCFQVQNLSVKWVPHITGYPVVLVNFKELSSL